MQFLCKMTVFLIVIPKETITLHNPTQIQKGGLTANTIKLI